MKRTASQWLAISSISVVLVISAHARTRPRYGGNLRVETSAVVNNSADFLRPLIGDTLTSLDPQGKPRPHLALRWASQNGGKRWQFWIRSDAKLPDGSFLTATLIAQGLTALTTQFHRWQSVRASGDTLIFESDTPMPDLPAELASPFNAIAFADPSGATVGTGPFRIAGGSPNTVILKSNSDYWHGRPFVDSIEITGQHSVRAQWLDLNITRTDIAEVPPEEIRLAEQSRMRTAISPVNELLVLKISDDTPQLQDVHLRQAIADSIDRNSILNFIYQKQGETTGSLLPNWMTGYGMLFDSAQDLATARDIRAALPYIPALTIAYPSGDSTLQLIAERVALNIRDAGLNVQTSPDNATVKADMHLVLLHLQSDNPAVALAGIANELGMTMTPLPSNGMENIYNTEQAMLSAYKAVPLLYLPTAYAASSRVRDWRVGKMGALSWRDYWLEDHK